MIIEPDELGRIREEHKNEKIVFAGGTFDIVHIGHTRALEQLQSYGDIVVVGLSADERVRERKGPERPILSQSERAEIMDALEHSDFVVKMPAPTDSHPYASLAIIEKLQPDLFVSSDKRWLEHEDEVTKLGTELKIVDRIHPTSTTKIIERILDKYADCG